ncbi:hypothetical protein CDL12_07893 [Handroanthus impetiginosus]|uniref:Uncharacterized protein n=1 Tax=Handroanthus impetiginosus TaxID=429701 RepID=A0A2G9HPH7_9LAMI|nr:hypothetical protein CDL12_07893 [Handroanthus impetiginosus]
MLIAASSSIFRRRENDSQDDELEVSLYHELDMQIAESSVVVNEQESEEEDTLEATWKAIIGGEKEKPKKKHLKKSEIFNHELDMQIAELSVVSPQPPLPAPPPPLDVTEVNEQESEEEDTLEATWKAIIGGEKEKPKKKHLKKSETWDVPPRCTAAGVRRLDSEEVLPSTPKWKELRKSETFNDAVSMTRRGGLRRDPSTNIEEFNQKIEAFIKKFNDNIRLQRQESHQRFLDMIGRGL